MRFQESITIAHVPTAAKGMIGRMPIVSVAAGLCKKEEEGLRLGLSYPY
jgi:hypothetical protein